MVTPEDGKVERRRSKFQRLCCGLYLKKRKLFVLLLCVLVIGILKNSDDLKNVAFDLKYNHNGKTQAPDEKQTAHWETLILCFLGQYT